MQSELNKIFTFLDFENGVPPYLNLCIDTWRKNLKDDFEIIILNRENFKNYIDKYLLTESVTNPSKPFTHFFCDYVAALILYSNGGIFIDADTIITDSFDTDFKLCDKYDTAVYKDTKNNMCSGFLMAQKYSKILEELIRRYRFENYLPIRNQRRDFILDDVIKNANTEKVQFNNSRIKGFLLEEKEYGLFDEDYYRYIYFTNSYNIETFLKNTNGITALHNSLTPIKYKYMSEKEFLNQDILLSKIFRVLL